MRSFLNVMAIYHHDQLEKSRNLSRDFGLAVGVPFIMVSTYQDHSCYCPPKKAPKTLSQT